MAVQPEVIKRSTPRPLPADRVTVASGDGIGPEITDAVLHVLRTADPSLKLVPVDIGERAYKAGASAGIDDAAWQTLAEHGVLLKGPITTPQGGGYKSVNVTLRKALGLFANVRPCTAYHPFVQTRHPGMDVVIVRENEEDTYGGIEHRQTREVYQCLKLVSRPGCERVIRHAFEYARAHGRQRVSCFTKDNIMKLTDGLFHKVFDEIAAEYPDLEHDHMIIDIGAARLAARPEDFDVIVTLNLYGDILSDIAAEVAGSVGLAGSANIGERFAMFEAIHGSAPQIAGKNVANPSGMLMAAVMMLAHMGRREPAEAIHNAWLRTLEDGLHTADIINESTTSRRVGTREFAHAVAERLGELPRKLEPVSYPDEPVRSRFETTRSASGATKQAVGTDVFLDWDESERDPQVLGERLAKLAGPDHALTLITNRGVKVWPTGMPQTLCTDHWRCRFLLRGESNARALPGLLERLAEGGMQAIKTENLYRFDGEPGFSVGQGE